MLQPIVCQPHTDPKCLFFHKSKNFTTEIFEFCYINALFLVHIHGPTNCLPAQNFSFPVKDKLSNFTTEIFEFCYINALSSTCSTMCQQTACQPISPSQKFSVSIKVNFFILFSKSYLQNLMIYMFDWNCCSAVSKFVS